MRPPSTCSEQGPRTSRDANLYPHPPAGRPGPAEAVENAEPSTIIYTAAVSSTPPQHHRHTVTTPINLHQRADDPPKEEMRLHSPESTRRARFLLTGGLANQLFQWAAAKTFAELTHTEFILDARYVQTSGQRGEQLSAILPSLPIYERDDKLFRFLAARKATSGLLRNLLKRTYFPATSDTIEKHLLRGSMHLHRYRGLFLDNRHLLTNDSIRLQVSGALSARYSTPDESYSIVHVRRGDYSKNPEYRRRFGLCSDTYYARSMALLDEGQHWIVIGDDRQATKQVTNHLRTLGHNTSTGPSQDHYSDLALLANADAVITANSTFSWWGAYLSSSAKVVYPKPWYNEESSIIFAPSWTPIARDEFQA